jgi:hypothetical protein
MEELTMESHMQVFDKISKEIDHGAGMRYMAIPVDLMSDAPASLLTITTKMSGRDIINGADIGLVELTKRQKILKTKTYLVFAFKDAEGDMTHEEALAFAERTHMRLLDKEEAKWFHKNFNKLTMWQASLNKNKWYWTSSVYSDSRIDAWQFSGSYGFVNLDYRGSSYGVRCVGLP